MNNQDTELIVERFVYIGFRKIAHRFARDCTRPFRSLKRPGTTRPTEEKLFPTAPLISPNKVMDLSTTTHQNPQIDE